MTVELPPGSRRVAVEILVRGPSSRAELAKTLGLSPATLTRVVRPLLQAGVLTEHKAVRTAGRGRASLPLDVADDGRRFVGVKLTAEAVYAVVTDLRAQVLDSSTVPEPSHEVSEVVATVLRLVEELRDRSQQPIEAVGVTVGGLVHKGDVVADSPFLDWHDVPFRAHLAAELDVPVHLDNDVAGLTRLQQWFGPGRHTPDFALITVGAGVGYGLVINGELVPTLANPFSHFPIDPHGPLCPRGHRGCMTAYVTTDAVTSAVSVAHRRPVSFSEALQLAEGGDPAARRVVDDAAHALGLAAAAVSSLTGVQRIILSGEGVDLATMGAAALGAGRRAYGLPVAGSEDLLVRPMDFLEWARGAAVVAVQAMFL